MIRKMSDETFSKMNAGMFIVGIVVLIGGTVMTFGLGPGLMLLGAISTALGITGALLQ